MFWLLGGVSPPCASDPGFLVITQTEINLVICQEAMKISDIPLPFSPRLLIPQIAKLNWTGIFHLASDWWAMGMNNILQFNHFLTCAMNIALKSTRIRVITLSLSLSAGSQSRSRRGNKDWPAARAWERGEIYTERGSSDKITGENYIWHKN